MTKVRFPRMYQETLEEMSECAGEPLCWRELYMTKGKLALKCNIVFE